MPQVETKEITGLTPAQVDRSRANHGMNVMKKTEANSLLRFLLNSLKEPMVLILILASVLYYFHGDIPEALFLGVSIIIVSSISSYQEVKSRNALTALEKLTQPTCQVLRGDFIVKLPIEELVVDDIMIVEEGGSIPADGVVIQSHDFSVNESILTGEAYAVTKKENSPDQEVFKGCSVLTGRAMCKVLHVGAATKLGRIADSMESIQHERTPLELQISDLVKKMSIAGAGIFITIWTINFFRTKLFIDSLLNSLTLAMSLLPEEIPVALAAFMALGARRLMSLGVIVKRTDIVEALGAASVICLDKTGTITQNIMALEQVFVESKDKVCTLNDHVDIEEVITTAMWASEPVPFDPMERALHSAYKKIAVRDLRPEYNLIHEYPLSGTPPLMTHIFKNSDGDLIIAAKGAPEAILAQSVLTQERKDIILHHLNEFSTKGYRVLAVGSSRYRGTFPEDQQQFTFDFKGLLVFLDPPKPNIRNVLDGFYKAGINVKIITGDALATTTAIAEKVGLRSADHFILAEQLMLLTDHELDAIVEKTSIFARMYPAAKLRVIESLKRMSLIVAMTGDGVNDGPALKAANIGISMGKRGSELAKEASAIILQDDDLERMIDAIAVGRRIYSNLRKAILYIISIHIPIILIVFLPLLLGWIFPSVFTPLHVIFLELIMGPTCSIIYENEPVEDNIMNQKPRTLTKSIFTMAETVTSVIQGIVIALMLVVIYWNNVNAGSSLGTTTAMIFVAMITANISLTLTNRSFYYSIWTTIRYKNRLIPIVIGITIASVLLMFFVQPLRSFFRFDLLTGTQTLYSVGLAFGSVIWIEVYKVLRNRLPGSEHPV